MPSTALTLAALSIFLFPVFAQSPPPSYHGPLRAELMVYLDVRRVHPGSPVYVRVSSDWSGLGCFLPSGQILEARVALATKRATGNGESQLALAFPPIPCGKEAAPMTLVLAAAAWSYESTAMSSAQSPIVHYSMARTGSVNTIQGSFLIDGLQFMSLMEGSGSHATVKPGDLLGIKGETLRMGAGPDRSSLLVSKTRDVYLEKESRLLLVPASVAFLPAAAVDKSLADSSAETTAAANTPPVPPNPLPSLQPSEFLPCEPPECTVDLPHTAAAVSGTAQTSVAIRPLGYSPRPQKELEDLDNDDALAWLGPHQLLLAFNPHTLIPRNGPERPGAPVRQIRAVLIDPRSGKVESTADWELSDTGEYLWQLARNRVLVHVGNELRVYAEDMQVETRIPLQGPLAFVRISPNGELAAIAVIQESHDPELHDRLRESLGADPEENIEIRIFDRNFNPIAGATATSHLMPPMLLNEGQVQLLAKPKNQYRLLLLPWTGSTSTIARFSSSCLPAVSTFAPDLLFARTCNPLTGIHEFRVLRPNGDVLLGGRSDLQDLGQEVLGTGERFAVKILHATRPVAHGSIFHGADLDAEEVRLYLSGNGKRVASVRLEAPPPSHRGFALSPDGLLLAVVAGSRLNVFTLPAD